MSRERILSDIRSALRRDGPINDSVASALRQRLTDTTPHEQPGLQGDAVDCFISAHESSGGTLQRVQDESDTATAVAAFCDAHEIPHQAVISTDPVINDIQWPARFEVTQRVAGRDDQLSVSGVRCAIGETGSLVLRSSEASPTTLNFLPDNHVAVVRASQIVKHLEDGWAMVRDEAGRLPRAVNLITGPSKTADVEQYLQHGAHGPCRVHVILIEDTD